MELKERVEKIKKYYSKERIKKLINIIIVTMIAIMFYFTMEKRFFFISYLVMNTFWLIKISIMALVFFIIYGFYAFISKYTKSSFKGIILISLIVYNSIFMSLLIETISLKAFISYSVLFLISCFISFCTRIEGNKEKAEDMKNRIKNNKAICIIANLFLITILAYALQYGIAGQIKGGEFINIRAYLFSFFLFMLLFITLWAALKKTNKAIIILGIVIIILSVISNIKYYYSDNPIYLSDIFFLGNVGEITSLVTNDIFKHIDYKMILEVTSLVMLSYLFSHPFVIELDNIKERGIILGINVFIWVILIIPISVKDTFILEKIFRINERVDYYAITDGKMMYLRNGIFGQMYDSLIESRGIKPKGYDEEELKAFLEKADIEEDVKVKYGKPNVIIMFQESFWDIENLEEVDFDKDCTAELDKLKELGTHAKFLSPSYGGLSSNIEFELLTGGNLRFYSFGFNPLSQLYKSVKATKYPSIVKEFNNNGYKTSVLFGRDYYNSRGIYNRLGIKNYTDTFKDWPEYQSLVKGNFISDEVLVNDVLNRLRNKEKDEKLFHMTCTIQTHMPFYKEKYPEYDLEYVKSELTTEQEEIVLSYAQGVYDTNLQIKRLYDEIQNIDDPTIVIVLGDHMPHLYDSNGVDILLSSRYFNTGDEKENLARKYTTDLFVFSNYGYKPEFAGEYVSPDLVLTTIINDLDLDISPFYKWLYKKTSKEIVAINQYLVVDKEGNYYLTSDEISKEMEDVLDLRKKMQYYLFK